MFEVNGIYANRKGKYTVLAINEPKMHVRYEDGAEAQSLETAVSIDNVELESYPKLAKMRLESFAYLKISEDDFELLAELLTEVTEDEDIDTDDDYEEDVED